jgi:putative flippase GtrA
MASLAQMYVRFKKPILFVIFGAGGTLLVTSITYLLTEYVGWWYFYSYIVATLITWSVLFLCHSHVTFRGHSKEGYIKRYLSFMLGYMGVFVVGASLVYSLTSWIGVPYIISILTASVLTSGINFFFSSRYVYAD